MRYNKVAMTDIEVSELGFGTWTLATSWWGGKTDQEAVSLLREACELGVTYYDTADTYGNGRGEWLLAEAFSSSEREKIVIGTKFGYDWKSRAADEQAGHQEAPHDWSLPYLESALHGSLDRLDTDSRPSKASRENPKCWSGAWTGNWVVGGRCLFNARSWCRYCADDL